MDDRSNGAAAVLQLLLTKGLGNRTLGRILQTLIEEARDIEDLVATPERELVSRYHLKPGVADGIRQGRDQAERLAHELYSHDVAILVLGAEGYPCRLSDILGSDAPAVLFARGNRSILDRPAVGLSGSRDASDRGIRLTCEIATRLGERGMNIVSGYANGVDLAAHQAALSAGGVTTMVLAEGILKFRSKHDLAHLFDEDNHLILSEFPPRLPWSVHNAMHRNRVVCALSDSVVVIEAGLSGGTFAAAEKTLQLRRPLFVVDYANPPPSAEGNRHFLGKGAIPLRRDREGKANLQPVLDVILGTRAVTQSKAATMRLFDLPDDGKRASAEPARHKEPAA